MHLTNKVTHKYLPSKHPSHGFPVGRSTLAASNIDLAIMTSVSENAT